MWANLLGFWRQNYNITLHFQRFFSPWIYYFLEDLIEAVLDRWDSEGFIIENTVDPRTRVKFGHPAPHSQKFTANCWLPQKLTENSLSDNMLGMLRILHAVLMCEGPCTGQTPAVHDSAVESQQPHDRSRILLLFCSSLPKVPNMILKGKDGS